MTTGYSTVYFDFKVFCLVQVVYSISGLYGMRLHSSVLRIVALLNDLYHSLCADSDHFCDASFLVLKEDPHCVLVQSAAVPDDTAEVNHGQNCSSDKSPNMEEKLQEVEKVIILYYE